MERKQKKKASAKRELEKKNARKLGREHPRSPQFLRVLFSRLSYLPFSPLGESLEQAN